MHFLMRAIIAAGGQDWFSTYKVMATFPTAYFDRFRRQSTVLPYRRQQTHRGHKKVALLPSLGAGLG